MKLAAGASNYHFFTKYRTAKAGAVVKHPTKGGNLLRLIILK
jgi:hypothetical protein